jgi:hypothetical protein
VVCHVRVWVSPSNVAPLPVRSGNWRCPTASRAPSEPPECRTGALPFFICYDIATEVRLRRSKARLRAAGHACEPGAFVEVGDAPELLNTWLGDHTLPVRHVPMTAAGIRAIGIETARGQVAIPQVWT